MFFKSRIGVLLTIPCINRILLPVMWRQGRQRSEGLDWQ